MKLAGRVWKLGDNVAAADILPARYDKAAMAGNAAECGAHVLADLRPDFASAVRPGDIIVAGANLGRGHAHYHRGAIIGCQAVGIGSLFGETVNGLFLRAAIDEGCPVWDMRGITDFVEDGDILEIDLATGEAHNVASGKRQKFAPLDSLILGILEAGSTFNWALETVQAK